MRELLSNNSLFVGQLKADLLYNWPLKSELFLNNSLLELIYFLNKQF